MGVVIIHNLLDPNPRPLLVQNISVVQKVAPREGFLTHTKFNTGNKQFADKTYDEVGMRSSQKHRFVTPSDP